jgi:hypothetical protein
MKQRFHCELFAEASSSLVDKSKNWARCTKLMPVMLTVRIFDKAHLLFTHMKANFPMSMNNCRVWSSVSFVAHYEDLQDYRLVR